MKRAIVICSALLFAASLKAQHHDDNWIVKNASDTTIVRCWNDSLTMLMFPAGSMMGMMYPDSIFCRVDRMKLDSLMHPHDSTFIGWHRIQIGRDSLHYDMMDDSMMGGRYQMQFMMGLVCSLEWDSLMTDSLHRHWHPTGIRGWNGSQWVNIQNAVLSGETATVITQQLYSAVAFVGEPSVATGIGDRAVQPSGFALGQNYPNPFNPSTVISYSLPGTQRVKLIVYNELGQQVETLVDGVQGPGIKSVTFSAGNLASGVYLYTLTAGTLISSKRMLLVK